MSVDRHTVEDWLYAEAELLDNHEYDAWLELLSEDVVYRAPMRLTARRKHAQIDDSLCLFDENIHSLRLRVRRLGTDVAWAEDPPSRTRRVIGNVRLVAPPEAGQDLTVRSNLLLFRNRGDEPHHDLLAAERTDSLRQTDAGLRLASRSVVLDQVVVGTKNLGIFL